MNSLERMKLGHRILLTMLIALVILLGLTLFGYLSGRWEEAGAQQQPIEMIELYTDVPLDMRLLQLDKRALDEAYHQQMLKLWSVWLAQGAPDPEFFKNGLATNRRAYNTAAKQLSARESTLFEQELQRRQQGK